MWRLLTCRSWEGSPRMTTVKEVDGGTKPGSFLDIICFSLKEICLSVYQKPIV